MFWEAILGLSINSWSLLWYKIKDCLLNNWFLLIPLRFSLSGRLISHLIRGCCIMWVSFFLHKTWEGSWESHCFLGWSREWIIRSWRSWQIQLKMMNQMMMIYKRTPTRCYRNTLISKKNNLRNTRKHQGRTTHFCTVLLSMLIRIEKCWLLRW